MAANPSWLLDPGGFLALLSTNTLFNEFFQTRTFDCKPSGRLLNASAVEGYWGSLKWYSKWRQISLRILWLQSVVYVLLCSSLLCTYLPFQYLSHLAGSKCCELSFLRKICFCPFHPCSTLLPWSVAPYFFQVILSPIFLTGCSPASHLSSLLLSLSFSGWLVDSFYCLLSAGVPSEEHSCCGQAMCGCACCRGEPNAAKFQRAPFQA